MRHDTSTGLAILAILVATFLGCQHTERERLRQDYRGVLLGQDKKLTSGELTDLMDTLGTVRVASCYENPGVANMLKYLQAKGITNKYNLFYWAGE